MRYFLRKLFRKGFRIELEDKYCYPQDKAFVMADAAVMRCAIAQYCAKNNHKVAFVREEAPITFILDGEERYCAKLEMGYGRGNYGYHIHCLEIMDE